MISLDRRTRSDSDARALGFVDFHEGELPRLLAGAHGEAAARAARVLKLPSLAFEVDGRAYTWRLADGRLAIAAGDADAEAVARLAGAAFSDLMQDLRSTVGLIIGDAVEMRRGTQQTLIAWEPVLRAVLDGRDVYAPGSIELRDRGGARLDLGRSFTLGDPPDDMAHFLGEAGFLVLHGVFAADEMRRIDADIDRAVGAYTPGDGRSWWARTRAGEHRPVRLQHFQEHSAAVDALLDDPRLLSVAALTSDGHGYGSRRRGNAIEALIKPIGVTEGISDVTWHKDCSLGRHSYQCCGITVGISVTASDEESGQLCVVAGSHRASLPLKGLREDLDLPRVGLPTSPGDVTVHLSCTYHMSIPPKTAERRVMYSSFVLPERAGDASDAGAEIRRIRERAPEKALELRQTSIGEDADADRRRGFDRSGLR